jgi:hypothetical protein
MLERVAGLVAGVYLVAANLACSFDHGIDPVRVDASLDGLGDGTIDVPEGAGPKSCRDLYAEDSTRDDGTYQVDPDGYGPEPMISVTCDMTTAGGGWTMVFSASTANYMTPPTDYDVSSSALLAGAQTVLLAYRDANGRATGSIAELDIPQAWRDNAPFDVPGADVLLPVAIDGGAVSIVQLRYGRDSFGPTCDDPWSTNERFGRICIRGTLAPFYNGFASSSADRCSDSLSVWYARSCSSDLRFSIGVR